VKVVSSGCTIPCHASHFVAATSGLRASRAFRNDPGLCRCSRCMHARWQDNFPPRGGGSSSTVCGAKSYRCYRCFHCSPLIFNPSLRSVHLLGAIAFWISLRDFIALNNDLEKRDAPSRHGADGRNVSLSRSGTCGTRIYTRTCTCSMLQ
jgi:hypothetical protein